MLCSVVIPSLDPDEKLLKVVDSLIASGFLRVILVDDGSRAENRCYFDAVTQRYPQCVLLRHSTNLGKGRALKTAFRYFLENRGDDIGVVTVDGDGQHLAKDAVRCADALVAQPDALVLGVRNFAAPDVPARSMMGNRITAGVFRYLCGISVSDTQTGLRCISAEFAEILLEVPGERFEFETNMLLETKRCGIAIREVVIDTVYIAENATSHFRAFRDSFSIYKLIFKFFSSSIASAALDLLLFFIATKLLGAAAPHERILAATIVSRVGSSAFNYFCNHKFVFKSRAAHRQTVVRYYVLALLQMLCSYAGVYALSHLLGGFETVSKAIVDTLLFLISFQIQQRWVFARKT